MPERERILDWNDPQHLGITLRLKPIATAAGGRPEGLTWLDKRIYWSNRTEWYEHMHRRLKALAHQALAHHDVGRVVATLDRGWETALVEAAHERDIPVDIVLPFRGVASRWDLHHRQRFGRLLDKADSTDIVHPSGFVAWAYAAARRSCLERSDLVLALWNGREDRVGSDLERAHEQDKDVVNLWESWRRYGGLAEP